VPPALGWPRNDCPEALLLLLARGPKSLPRPVANLNLAANLRAADSVLLGEPANLIPLIFGHLALGLTAFGLSWSALAACEEVDNLCSRTAGEFAGR
jgi:hypothetical protein